MCFFFDFKTECVYFVYFKKIKNTNKLNICWYNYYKTRLAAPITPASFPKVAKASLVEFLTVGKANLSNSSFTLSKRNSPAAETPPPITI